MIDASYTELKAGLLFPLKSTLASIRVISRIMSLCSYKIKHSVPGKEGKKPSILSIQPCNYLVATWGRIYEYCQNTFKLKFSPKIFSIESELSEWSEESNNIYMKSLTK